MTTPNPAYVAPTEQCRFMAAAYPTLTVEDTCLYHRHDEATFALARAIAAAIHQAGPTDEQVAWTLDDAGAVVDDFDPLPSSWAVTQPVQVLDSASIDFALTINGEEYVIPESEWEESHPVRRAEWERWNQEPDDDRS